MKMARINLPKYLKSATKKWIRQILTDYELESHHSKILISAGETWDRILEAQEQVKKDGPYFTDRFGCPKTHPALADERNGRVLFARLIRELNLSEGPPETRPPGLKYK